jgi:hypothetical protein
VGDDGSTCESVVKLVEDILDESDGCMRRSSVVLFCVKFADNMLSSPHHLSNVDNAEYVSIINDRLQGEERVKADVAKCVDVWKVRKGSRKGVVEGIVKLCER